MRRIRCSIGDIFGKGYCKNINAQIHNNPYPKFVKPGPIPYLFKGPIGDAFDLIEYIGVLERKSHRLCHTDFDGDETTVTSYDFGRRLSHGKPANHDGSAPAPGSQELSCLAASD